MEFSLFGGALALSRYVPAGGNVARATRSVLSLVSSESRLVEHSRQSGGRRRAMRHRLIVLAPASQLLFSAPVLRGPGA